MEGVKEVEEVEGLNDGIVCNALHVKIEGRSSLSCPKPGQILRLRLWIGSKKKTLFQWTT